MSPVRQKARKALSPALSASPCAVEKPKPGRFALASSFSNSRQRASLRCLNSSKDLLLASIASVNSERSLIGLFPLFEAPYVVHGLALGPAAKAQPALEFACLGYRNVCLEPQR